jgi:hypothetical protein
LIPKDGLLRAKKGQARLTESILAVGLILILFTTSIYLMSSSKVWTIYEKGDLDKLGYNLLSYLLETRVIDNLGASPAESAEQLKFLVERNLPPMTFFNLTIYKCISGSDGSNIVLVPWLKINNTDWEAFEASVEVSSTSVLYTSVKGSIYFIVLMLARSEEAIKREV